MMSTAIAVVPFIDVSLLNQTSMKKIRFAFLLGLLFSAECSYGQKALPAIPTGSILILVVLALALVIILNLKKLAQLQRGIIACVIGVGLLLLAQMITREIPFSRYNYMGNLTLREVVQYCGGIYIVCGGISIALGLPGRTKI
jgi:hypothetical protein